MSTSGFMKRHPVVIFYVLTFAISWGVSSLVILSHRGMPRDPAELAKLIPILIATMLAGPAVASLSLTGIVSGKAGYRDLFTRLLTWRVGVSWYLVALLSAPLVLMVIPLALSLRFPGFVPRIFTESSKGPLLQLGLAAGLAAGCFEELGWTGFVVPKLRPRFSAFSTGAIVGLLWGAWHLLINFWSSGTPSGSISIPSLSASLLFSFGLLPAYRILMVSVWDHTGSLLVAMLMHTSLTTSNIIFGATSTPGMMAPIFVLLLTAAMWAIVAISWVANRSRHRRLRTAMKPANTL